MPGVWHAGLCHLAGTKAGANPGSSRCSTCHGELAGQRCFPPGCLTARPLRQRLRLKHRRQCGDGQPAGAGGLSGGAVTLSGSERTSRTSRTIMRALAGCCTIPKEKTRSAGLGQWRHSLDRGAAALPSRGCAPAAAAGWLAAPSSLRMPSDAAAAEGSPCMNAARSGSSCEMNLTWVPCASSGWQRAAKLGNQERGGCLHRGQKSWIKLVVRGRFVPLPRNSLAEGIHLALVYASTAQGSQLPRIQQNATRRGNATHGQAGCPPAPPGSPSPYP